MLPLRFSGKHETVVRGSSLSLAIFVFVLSAPARARGDDWVFESGTSDERAAADIRFDIHVALWVASFDRPESACELSGGVPPLPAPSGGLELRQTARPLESRGFGCSSRRSNEVGFGTGGTVAFHVAGPLYLSMGANLVYTEPIAGGLSSFRNQVIVAIPFGIVLTVPEWSFRPILSPKITPLLYLTDDSRDYTLGGDLGFAWRLLEWGELSLTFGYEAARSVSSFAFQVGLHPF